MVYFPYDPNFQCAPAAAYTADPARIREASQASGYQGKNDRRRGTSRRCLSPFPLSPPSRNATVTTTYTCKSAGALALACLEQATAEIVGTSARRASARSRTSCGALLWCKECSKLNPSQSAKSETLTSGPKLTRISCSLCRCLSAPSPPFALPLDLSPACRRPSLTCAVSHPHRLVADDDDGDPWFLEMARKIPLCGEKIADQFDLDA